MAEKKNTRDQDILANKNAVTDKSLSSDWYDGKIEANNWNASLPFQLILVEEKDGKFLEVGAVSDTSHMDLFMPGAGAKAGTSRFTLPIPPSNLSISLPFASNLSFTLGGVVEEHSGAPLRIISFSGTTGVLPLRRSTTDPAPASFSNLGGIANNAAFRTVAGGTIDAAQSAISRAMEILSVSEDKHLYKGLAKEGSETEIAEDSTGYYQFHLLRKFLESYAAQKTLEKNKNLRLALAIWKDSAVYLVTPVQFVLQRSASSPLEYQYSLQFKAWKRINLSSSKPSAYDNTPTAERTSYLEYATRAIDLIRTGADGITGVVAGASSDYLALMNLLRDSAIAIKSWMEIPLTVKDIFNDTVASHHEIYESIKDIRDDGRAAWKKAWGDEDTPSGSSTVESRSAGLTEEVTIDPDEPYESSPLPTSVKQATEEKVRRASSFTDSDYHELRDRVQDTADTLVSGAGAGNAVYNEMYGYEGPVGSPRELDPEEAVSLYAFQALVQAFDSLAASTAYERDERIIPSAVEYVAALANEASIPFETIQSAFAVPVPYEVTLDRLAATYLGDPNRWHEIATLNGLREPFIDEEGFSIPLLRDADENKIVLASAVNLSVGKAVEILANGLPTVRTRIMSIEEKAGVFILTLADDVSGYTTARKASLHAYLPGTTNSSQLILIPSASPPESIVGVPEGVDRFDQLLEVGGVDLLLTDDGDIYLGTDGNTRWSYGLTNIIQSVRLLLTTPRGSLIHHPTYGLSVRVGDISSEVTASDILREIERSLEEDPAFESVTGISVERIGPSVRLSLMITVRGLSESVPVSFIVK